MLLFVDLLDELAGVVYVQLPGIRASLQVPHALAMLVTFTVPGIIAMVLEPPLLLLATRGFRTRPADQVRSGSSGSRVRQRWVIGGLVAMGLGLLLVSASPGVVGLALAMSAVFVGSGVGVNLAVAALMDDDPDRRELWMTRWVAAGTLGDLLAPVLVGLLALLGLGWRAAPVVVGVAVLVHAGVLSVQRFPAGSIEDDDDEESVPLRESVRLALSNRELVTWLGVLSLGGLLDEVFVAVAAAWLAHAHGADAAAAAAVLGLATVGGLVGLAVLERALARGVDAERWLVGVAALTVTLGALLLVAPDLWTATAVLFGLELVASQLYPLAKARAFRSHPEDSGIVVAVEGLFAPVDVLAPVLVGLIADRAGLPLAMIALFAQPLLVLAVAGIGAGSRARRG